MTRRPIGILSIYRAVGLAVVMLGLWPASAALAQTGTTICHATAGGFETVVIPEGEFSDHFDHEDDLIPAPAEGCPGATAAPSPTEAPPAEAPPAETPVVTATPSPAVTTHPVLPTPEATAAPAADGEAAAASPITAPMLVSTPAVAAAGLPRTGPDAGLVLAAGLGLLMAGCGLRRLSA